MPSTIIVVAFHFEGEEQLTRIESVLLVGWYRQKLEWDFDFANSSSLSQQLQVQQLDLGEGTEIVHEISSLVRSLFGELR